MSEARTTEGRISDDHLAQTLLNTGHSPSVTSALRELQQRRKDDLLDIGSVQDMIRESNQTRPLPLEPRDDDTLTALQLAVDAMKRVHPQSRGVLVTQDLEYAIVKCDLAVRRISPVMSPCKACDGSGRRYVVDPCPACCPPTKSALCPHGRDQDDCIACNYTSPPLNGSGSGG